jgi:hypothetical protein
MPGKSFQLTPLATRKALLLATSELNRVQLANEWRAFKQEIQPWQAQVQALGSLAGSAAKLTATFSAIGEALAPPNAAQTKKPAWISLLLNGAKAGTSLWLLLRSCRRKA